MRQSIRLQRHLFCPVRLVFLTRGNLLLRMRIAFFWPGNAIPKTGHAFLATTRAQPFVSKNVENVLSFVFLLGASSWVVITPQSRSLPKPQHLLRKRSMTPELTRIRGLRPDVREIFVLRRQLIDELL